MTSDRSVLVVGAGLMGRWHAHEATKAGARLAGIVDPDPLAARRLASRHGSVPTYGTLDTALADVAAVRGQGPAIVHVATPPATHAALIGAALDAGLDVLVEKPLAESVAEAEALFARADSRGRLLCAVHQFPFQRGMQRLRSGLPRLGAVVRASFVVASAGGDGKGSSERRRVLAEMLPHAVSLVRALSLGRAEWTVLESTADDLVLSARAGEATLSVALSLRARPTRCQLSVLGTEASAYADLFHGFSVLETGRPSRLTKAAAPFRLGGGLLTAAATNLSRRALEREPAYPGLGTLIRAFHASVASRGEPPVSRDEVLEAAALAEGALAEGALAEGALVEGALAERL